MNCTESLNNFLVLLQVLAVVLPLDEKKDVSTVVKPMEPVTVDLSDDDDDDCVEVSAKSPVKAEPKPSTCSNFLKAASVRQASIPSLHSACLYVADIYHLARQFLDFSYFCFMCYLRVPKKSLNKI